jgi:tetratricopeptide (TPR) repeat protein
MYDVADAVDSGQADAVPRAIQSIERGDTLRGLIVLEGLHSSATTALAKSYLAYCMAKERGQIREAVNLCYEALTADPEHPAHYLNLGRVWLTAGDKSRAIASFWRGISKNAGPESAGNASWPRNGRRREYDLIMDELRRLGIRKPPPFRSLQREHPLNRVAGRFLARIGMR